MNKINKIILFLVIFNIYILSCYANDVWYQEANAGLDLDGANGFLAFSSNQNNRLSPELVSYSRCYITGSVYTPIIADLNYDGVQDIITTNSNGFNVFSSSSCALEDQINLNSRETLQAMPVFTNFDENALQEIVVLSNSVLYWYQVNLTSQAYEVLKSINYSTVSSSADMNWFTCFRSATYGKYCIAFDRSVKNTYFFDYELATVSKNTNTLPYNAHAFGSSNGITTVIDGIDAQYSPFCFIQGATANDINCGIVNQSGVYNGITFGGLASASTAIGSIQYLSTFYARLGNLYRIFSNVEYTKTSPEHSYRVYDTIGNNVFNATYSTNQYVASINDSSNWMIADYNKDGLNEACILQDLNGTLNVTLRCWDGTFGTVLIQHNFTGILNISKSLVMADFVPSNPYMSISSAEGIFFFNSSLNMVQTLFKTNLTLSSTDHKRSGIVTGVSFSGSPIYVYATTSYGIVVQNSLISQLCGNNVCDAYESEFSCPADCRPLVTNGTCFIDTDCPDAYPKCLGGRCVNGYSGIPCINYMQCPINASLCFNGYCVAGIYQEIIDTNITNVLEGDQAVQNPDIIWSMLFSGSILWRLFIGMLLLVFFVSFINIKANPNKDPIMTIFIIGVGLVLFTLIQFINTWIAIFIILVAGSLFAIKIILFPKQSES